MLRHPLQEVLNTNHMKGEEAFLIFVFFVVATIEHIDTHLIDLTNGVEPESLLLTLSASLLIADLDDVSDQGIKLHDVHLVRLGCRCLSTRCNAFFKFRSLFILIGSGRYERNLSLRHVECRDHLRFGQFDEDLHIEIYRPHRVALLPT